MKKYPSQTANGGTTIGNQQQYETPPHLAAFFNALLPAVPDAIFDPQCASGNTLRSGLPDWTFKCGFEIDNRFASVNDGVLRAIVNCVNGWEILDDLYPELELECQVANPPFGLLWKVPEGGGKLHMDSTEYTWRNIMRRASPFGYGWFIANYRTIERLGLHEHPRVYLYQKLPAGIWKHCDIEIGVLHWDACPIRPKRIVWEWPTLELPGDSCGGSIRDFYLDKKIERPLSSAGLLSEALIKIEEIAKEEARKRPPFNIWLAKDGLLRAYLSTRLQVKRKITREEVLRVATINQAHPLTLTTDRPSRKLLADLINCGLYTIQPEARAAIESALAEVSRLASPLMPTTDFEAVGYCDEEDTLLCIADYPGDVKTSDDERLFTAGKKYELTTSSYKFTEEFTRQKPHFDEKTGQMYTLPHKCQLSGADRYILLRDDLDAPHRFMDRPQSPPLDHDEALLWKIFQKPSVRTVAETQPELVAKNKLTLATCEMLADFTYYPGQLDYLARIGAKDYGIIAADVGTGKTLCAISLIQMKGPHRALIIAPQGTMRSSESDDDDDEEASQWIAELTRFAPGLPVFQLFSLDDYQRILAANAGQFPPGVYISYYQAMFSNGARERAAATWDDKRLEKELARLTDNDACKLPSPPVAAAIINPERYWCRSIGEERNGIRCILQPCMATLLGYLFDMVCLDEGHLCTNLEAAVSQMLIRLQPKFRYIFTATPIPNVISNLFPLMGWVCVRDWYRGDRRNAAWPYSRAEIGRFIDTFQSCERDFTQEELNAEAEKKSSNGNHHKYRPSKCEKVSPIISSPARLIKILKPSMAYISKAMCSPAYREPKLVDVRVPLGRQQAALYAHFMDRGNIDSTNPLIRARKQITYLRNICADPAGFTHGGPKVVSNFNPKTLAILELARDILRRGDPLTIVCARTGQTNTLHTALHDAGILVSRVDSTISAEQHSHQSNLFKAHRTQVMLMGLKCAIGHSFHECPNMIIGSIEYSWGSLAQACGRIDRINSKQNRTIYCILHKHTIEETMFDVVATKQDAATIALRGQRIPRTFKPVDMSELLASSLANFKNDSTDETACESLWPKLRNSFKLT